MEGIFLDLVPGESRGDFPPGDTRDEEPSGGGE